MATPDLAALEQQLRNDPRYQAWKAGRYRSPRYPNAGPVPYDIRGAQTFLQDNPDLSPEGGQGHWTIDVGGSNEGTYKQSMNNWQKAAIAGGTLAGVGALGAVAPGAASGSYIGSDVAGTARAASGAGSAAAGTSSALSRAAQILGGAAPVVGALTQGNAGGSLSSNVNDLFAAMPQLKTMLDLQVGQAQRADPLHESLIRLSQRLLPNSAR